MTVSFESLVPYAFDEKWVLRTIVLLAINYERLNFEVAKRPTFQPSKIGEAFDLQSIRSFHEIWKVKSGNIIPNYNIRVDFLDEITPSLKHIRLV